MQPGRRRLAGLFAVPGRAARRYSPANHATANPATRPKKSYEFSK